MSATLVSGRNRAFWVPSRQLRSAATIGLAVAVANAPVQYVIQERAQEAAQRKALDEARRRETLAQYNDEYVRTVIDCATEVERTLKNGLPRRNGKRGRKPYQLGLASYGAEAEVHILCLLGFVDRVGFSIGSHDLDPVEVARLHGTEWSKWIPLIGPLLNARQLTLDEARREQVARVLTTLHLICDDDYQTRSARQRWSRITLTAAHLDEDPMGNSYLNVRIQNPNTVVSPVGAIRVAAKTHDGVLTGYWVVVPSDAGIAPHGEIEIGAHLEAKSNGVPGEIETIGNLAWLAEALGNALPAPAGQTHRLANGDKW